jgi:hypothetical protein
VPEIQCILCLRKEKSYLKVGGDPLYIGKGPRGPSTISGNRPCKTSKTAYFGFSEKALFTFGERFKNLNLSEPEPHA